MEMPRPTGAHRRLERLVGTWYAEERLHPSPWDLQGDTATGLVRNVLALDGFAVVQDYEQSRRGAVTFRGHGVFRWDPVQGYVLHWFDSTGRPPSEFRGHFEGDVLLLTSSGPQGHSRAMWDLTEAGRYRYRMEVSPDGLHWSSAMEGVYTRQ